MKKITFFILLSYLCLSQELSIQPYLQNIGTNSATIMWESNVNPFENSFNYIQWGENTNLESTSYGIYDSSVPPYYIYSVTLEDLNPNTKYYYRVPQIYQNTEIYNFNTNSVSSDEESISIIAMSDMQMDQTNPNKFNQIVNQGIINYIQTNYTQEINEKIDLILIPGDLVENGNNHQQWQDDFFAQSNPLFSYIPLYPVPGNHENDSPFFFKYFNLPENGTPGYEEHWWYKDISNVRIIGLDSNGPYRIIDQINWLQNILTETENNSNIDFVFAQLHHPHRSELWTPGNTDYTGEVIELLENFSANSGKPSIHFFGHTHGYSRGQSKEHNHLMVNVATGGGRIDYWGEYPNNDYEEYSVSQDEYGYVFIQVDAGNNPKFTLKRLSLGDEYIYKDNSLEDQITIRLNNNPPEKPVGIFPNGPNMNPDCINLLASIYFDSDGDEHGASQWQISSDCTDFSYPIYDEWRQHENWYNEINLQENDILIDEQINFLDENSDYCWRVRYRDKSLAWSEWSDPVSFQTENSNLSENLIENYGAENNINYWNVEIGILESLSAFECNGIEPYNGEKYFSIGGLCDESELGYAYQTIDVSSYEEEINSGFSSVFFGAHLASWAGNDKASIGLEFLDQNNLILFATEMYSSELINWNLIQKNYNIPFGTKKIKFKMMGELFSGSDNDSYVDEIFLKINTNNCSYYNDENTNIYEQKLLNISIAPNPFTNQSILNIPYSENNHLEIYIYNSLGQLEKIYNHVHPPTFELKKENLKSGLHFLEIYDNKKRIGITKFEIK